MENKESILAYRVKFNNLPPAVIGGESNLLNLLQTDIDFSSNEEIQGIRLENYLADLINSFDISVGVTSMTPAEGFKNYAQVNVCSSDENAAQVYITTALNALKKHTNVEYEQV